MDLTTISFLKNTLPKNPENEENFKSLFSYYSQPDENEQNENTIKKNNLLNENIKIEYSKFYNLLNDTNRNAYIIIFKKEIFEKYYNDIE